MPKPKFTSVTFKNHPTDPTKDALHKKIAGGTDKAEFTGCVNISSGDGIRITGSLGTFPTIWQGTITSVSGSKAKGKVKVFSEQSRLRKGTKIKPGAGGTEEVSTTVSNGQVSDPPVKTTIEPLP